MNHQILSDLFTEVTGSAPVSSVEILGSGSQRKYFRLTGADSQSLIGTIGTNRAENDAFMYLAGLFAGVGVHVPEIVAVASDHMAYLQRDLGDRSLFDCIRTDRHSPATWGLLRETMSCLPDIQFRAADIIDYSRCYPVASFDTRTVMWDLNYFKYSFLKPSGIDFDENALEDDFRRLCRRVVAERPSGFMYRDFQSRNVMIHDGAPWFIDFQGGRRGCVLYDVASFLWQARAGFSDEERRELAMAYHQSASRYVKIGDFNRRLLFMAFFRSLQVLGAYGFRGLLQQKAHFIESIRPAITNLASLLREVHLPACGELTGALDRLVQLPQYQIPAVADGLTIEVNSFGFRKSGIPRDLTGNGGGFVFDCRALTNPGRFPQYAMLTGMDAPVIEFLESGGEVQPFLENVFRLVGASVERYMRRGFTSLKVSFGCTGGRHRSVYCAERLAQWVNSTFGVRVELNHTEHDIHKVFNPRKC